MKIITIVVWCVMSIASGAIADEFQTVKDNLSRPGCHYFEFVSIVHSNVFDDIDSAHGTAYMASDGRYNIKIADDQYLCDGEFHYSYNVGSNQVIIEPSASGSAADEEFYFIVRLDELYHSQTVETGKRYRLLRREDAGGEYPDSMDVDINAKRKSLEQIEFYDINDDLNVIRFFEHDYFEKGEPAWFEADFPDSVEKVKL